MSCPECEGKRLDRPCTSCGNTPQVVEVNNPKECPVTFHTVEVPADRGDDRTGEVLPANGLYKNVILKYLANKAVYIYNSDGIPCKIETAPESLYFDDLLNRPKYNDVEMTSATNIPLVPTSAAAYSGNYSDLIDLPEIDSVLSAASQNAVQNAAIANAIDGINSLVPNQASASNQLADKDFVNSTIQTVTANFRGSWETWSDVPTNAADYPEDYAGSTIPTPNDYLIIGDASGYPTEELSGAWRFKYIGNWDSGGKDGWTPEYQLNNTVFTAEQLAALNSGITASLVSKIVDFTGATGSTNGLNGLVPAPLAGDEDKYLKGDGTWSSGPAVNVLDFYPVGSYYETSDTTFDPNTAWGGTWVEDSAGRVLVANDSGTFSTVSAVGGSETSSHYHATYGHTLTVNEMPSHSHNFTGGYHSHTTGNSGHDAWLCTSSGNDIMLGSTGHTGPSGSGSFYYVFSRGNDGYGIVEQTVSSSTYTDGTVWSNGGSQSHSHGNTSTASSSTVQPYLVVKRWHRTA